jgi:hypothetical protein
MPIKMGGMFVSECAVFQAAGPRWSRGTRAAGGGLKQAGGAGVVAFA